MRAWVKWVPAVVWMGVIFMLSGQPGERLNAILPILQKAIPEMHDFDWGHFFAYFVLALTYFWGIGRFGVLYMLASVGLCFLYGLTDEFHQQFVAGRSPDWMDIRNDCIGATLAMAMLLIPPIKRFWLRLLGSSKY